MNILKWIVAILISCLLFTTGQAEEQKKSSPEQDKKNEKVDARLIPLNKKKTVLLDKNGKRILLKTKVVLREGLLEMLCTIKEFKEHESIVSIDAEAYVIHAGLLAIGAKPGAPVIHYPKYKPASGQRLEIYLQWKDKAGKLHRENANKWIRRSINRYYVEKFSKKPNGLTIPRESKLSYEEKVDELVWYGPMTAIQKKELLKYSKDKKYQKAINRFFKEGQTQLMKANWLFAGSYLTENPEKGKPAIYAAQSGDLICVANFPSSMIDLDIRSSADGNENLLFEANTENIPALGTEVTIELIPVVNK